MEQINVIKTEVIPIDLSIRTAMGTISRGWSLRVILERDGTRVTVDTCNLCEFGLQTRDWCVRQCDDLSDELVKANHFSPGEIMRLLHCGYGPLAKLGIPIPPQKHDATMVEMREFHAKTGRGMVYIENDLYREWATAYNQWIQDHPEEALDFGCTWQDESWIPVK